MTEPSLKRIESIKIYGFSARTKNSDEFNEKTAKIPSLWQRFCESSLINQTDNFGVYSNYESDASGLYTVTAGVLNPLNEVGIEEIIIESGQYLVFEKEGPIPEIVHQTWQEIWDYFSHRKLNQRNFLTDFEFYNAKDRVAIYIGIHSE